MEGPSSSHTILRDCRAPGGTHSAGVANNDIAILVQMEAEWSARAQPCQRLPSQGPVAAVSLCGPPNCSKLVQQKQGAVCGNCYGLCMPQAWLSCAGFSVHILQVRRRVGVVDTQTAMTAPADKPLNYRAAVSNSCNTAFRVETGCPGSKKPGHLFLQ